MEVGDGHFRLGAANEGVVGEVQRTVRAAGNLGVGGLIHEINGVVPHGSEAEIGRIVVE